MYRISTIYSICMCSCAIERCAIVLYAIAYASPPPPCMAPAPRIHRSSLPYTSGRPHSSRGTSRDVGRIYFTQEEKAPTAPLLIVHEEDLAKTGECDHVVSFKDILAVSTQAKLHTRMHSTCTMLRYIFQPVQATAPSHLAQHRGPCTRTVCLAPPSTLCLHLNYSCFCAFTFYWVTVGALVAADRVI